MSSSRVRIGGGLLLAAALCLGSASPAITQMPGSENRAVRPGPLPYPYCDFIKKVGVDVLDDGIEMPDAWNQTSVVMGESQTELPLRVYALTNEVRFYDKLSGYPRQVSTRIVGAGGRDPLRVRVRYTEEGDEPHWVLRVLRRPRRGRTISMHVNFTCKSPRTVYQGRLIVTVPGRLPAPE